MRIASQGMLAAALILLPIHSVATSHDGILTQSFLTNVDKLHEQRRQLHWIVSTIQAVDVAEWSVTDNHVDSVNAPTLMHTTTRSSNLEKKEENQQQQQLHHRNLQGGSKQAACDSSFVRCIPDAKCVDCFASLEMGGIDWTGVKPGTACPDVVSFLVKGGHCESLQSDPSAKNLFCQTFDDCVIWNDQDNAEDDDNFDPSEAEGWVNCTALTSCMWDGMHPNWIGDGVCHDNMHGCYNTAICDYDGGDCCQDTCEINEATSYMECGHDGYACRDPSSALCDKRLNTRCPNNGSNGGDPSNVKCTANEAKYRLIMYDSFGDGWDTTTLTIQPEGGGDKIITAGLPEGFQGTEYICLSKDPTCYNVVVGGGTWGVEVSWEIRPLIEGSPSIAGGGSPMDCDFSVAGEVCPNTCDRSKPPVYPNDDPDYKTFKDLYACIEKKCVIQLGACQDDPQCKQCFVEDASDYCYGVDTFLAVVDCTMCSCTDREDSDYCSNKSAPGQVVPPANSDNENYGPKACTPRETMAGASAIMDFSKCSNLDEVGILVSEFDQNNFGQLDTFEACAHAFRDETNHGGHTAMGCMSILKNAINNPIVDVNSDAPKEAISALARSLYEDGESFCECAQNASDKCPLCPSFMSFKTILYESIDACQSLDEIDCDSWNEFWKPCQINLERQYQSSDFSSKDQCDYVKSDCGGAGTFPAFRRLDCEKELPQDAWSFYKQFNRTCLSGADGIPPGDNPTAKPYVPSPTSPPSPGAVPTSTGDKPTPKPYVPTDDKPGKPYVPPDDKSGSTPSSDQSSPKKTKSKWFRNFLIIILLGGVGYYVYKKRSEGFNFVQYRRRVFGNRFGGGGFDYGMVNMGTGDSEMFSNLNSSTTFEPPSLPPTPQMMMGTEMT